MSSSSARRAAAAICRAAGRTCRVVMPPSPHGKALHRHPLAPARTSLPVWHRTDPLGPIAQPVALPHDRQRSHRRSDLSRALRPQPMRQSHDSHTRQPPRRRHRTCHTRAGHRRPNRLCQAAQPQPSRLIRPRRLGTTARSDDKPPHQRRHLRLRIHRDRLGRRFARAAHHRRKACSQPPSSAATTGQPTIAA